MCHDTGVCDLQEQGDMGPAYYVLFLGLWVAALLPCSVVEMVPGYLFGFKVSNSRLSFCRELVPANTATHSPLDVTCAFLSNSFGSSLFSLLSFRDSHTYSLAIFVGVWFAYSE
jgi:hypothetical protein